MSAQAADTNDDGAPAGQAPTGQKPAGPLEGLVVADFSRVLAGPYATMMLGDLGATVVKVESPAGDDTRAWSPPERDGVSTYYLSAGRNKRSIALDLRNPEDLATANKLLDRADVMVENFKPGGLAAFGLDTESVRADRPGLIVASLTGFGSAGGAKLPGYDLLVQAVSGLMSVTGEAEGEPTKVGVAAVDVMMGLHATVGILAALQHRGRTGEGQVIEVNLLSSALSGLVNQASAVVAGGVVPGRMGNEHPSLTPYAPYPTADGPIVIAVGNNGQFAKLCQCLGLGQLADDPKFATNPARNQHRVELNEQLNAALAERDAEHWFRVLSEAGVPAAPINTVDGGVELARSLGLDPVVDAGEDDDAVPGIRNPINFSATPAQYRLAPPGTDADREHVLDWLERGQTR